MASLADLRQEVAGTVPVEVIKSWETSAKQSYDQNEILRPFERDGYYVTTDSAGLSRLTTERTLIEVMKLVSEPKEIVFEHGRAIGGRGLGIWAADNSAMFYDAAKVKADQLVEKMVAAQKQIHRGLLQVGMGIHRGKFWELGMSLFGEQADLVEHISEDFTDAQEIVLSESVRAELSPSWHDLLVAREDLTGFKTPFYHLNYDQLGDWDGFDRNILDHPKPENFYPFPFSSDFFLALKRNNQAELDNYYKNKVVILIKNYHHKERLLLQELTDWVVVNAVWLEVAQKYDVEVVKSNGDLGIFVADRDSEAVEFAEDLLLSSRSGNDRVSIGLCRGDVLLFRLDGGAGKDIAGGAVNIASKISEDVEGNDTFYVEASVQIPAHHFAKFENFVIEKSKVIIAGQRYKQ